ncbi:MAG: hypothetical protein GY705_29665, partial [Bacteroidetes bacterium]|nr:hypothetical protein [Bacteroidota bacterium]
DEIFADRIGLKELAHYSHLKSFLPLLEKRGNVVLVEEPEKNVDGVFQFADYIGQSCLYIYFSPPDQKYVEIIAPKIFISSVTKFRNDFPARYIRSNADEYLTIGIQQSLGGITHCTESKKKIISLVGDAILLETIPPPIWDSYQKLFDKDFPEHTLSATIYTQGDILDTTIKGLRPKSISYRIPFKRRMESIQIALQQSRWLLALEYLVHRKSRHYYPTDLVLTGIVYTAIIRPSNPFKNWKNLINDFCTEFKNTGDAILVLKMAGRVKESTKSSEMRFLRWKSGECRIVIINEHLPQDEYENLVCATAFIINNSTSDELGNSLLEFMSAGKPAISSQYEGIHRLNYENTFIVPTGNGAKFSIRKQLRESYDTIKNDRGRYHSMAKSATELMKEYCSKAVIEPRFFAFLDAVEARLP